MSKRSGWFKGLVGLLVVAALAWALAWLFGGAGQAPRGGQEAAPTGGLTPERKMMLTDTSPPRQVVTPTTTLSPTGEVTPTATPGNQETVRILYAVQPPGKAVTLWTLDYDPATDAISTHELTTSPYESAAYLRVYEVSVSPNGQYVALNLRGGAENLDTEVWTVDLESGAFAQLPSLHHSGLIFMDWIPGTNRLLARDLDGGNIALMNRNGSDVQELPYHMFQDGAASPDGQQFVLSAMEENTFWFLNTDGTLIKTVPVPDKERPGGGAPFGLTWSPDGQKLAYFDNFADENSQIRVMVMDTGKLEYLSSDDAGNIFPVWFQDSATLLYLRDPRPGTVNWAGGDPTRWNTSLWIAEVKTEQYRELVPSGDKTCWSPAWLPDGSGIVFVSNRLGQNDIWLVNGDGSGLRQLTTRGDVVALDIFPSK